MKRTYVILDGLQDPGHAEQLSKLWMRAGFANVIDASGQWAWLAQAGPSQEEPPPCLTEEQVDHAASLARSFGLELRDRVGATFHAANSLESLQQRVSYEYKSRLATALMFALPAIALHYLGPWLAGGSSSPRDMLYPWLFEMLLVGWSIIAAGWPILWQGGLSLVHVRQTADLFFTLILLTTWLPSALGVVGLVLRIEPFYAHTGPMFHAAGYALLLVVLQRWLLHRAAPGLGGKAMLLIPQVNRILHVWLIIAGLVLIFGGWGEAIAFALLLPPLVSFMSINPWTPGYASLLPTVAFGGLMLLDRQMGAYSLDTVRIEVAAGFSLLQTIVMAIGWRRMQSP